MRHKSKYSHDYKKYKSIKFNDAKGEGFTYIQPLHVALISSQHIFHGCSGL